MLGAMTMALFLLILLSRTPFETPLVEFLATLIHFQYFKSLNSDNL
jgi:hypothetical protein